MKKWILRFSCLALLLLPGVISAGQFVGVSVTLDNPFQTVTAPTSGFSLVNFTGTVSVDPALRIDQTRLDNPFNNAQTNSLSATYDPAFLTFAFGPGTGTYTGSLFNVNVPAGTLPDLYAFKELSTNPSVLFVEATFADQAFGAGSPNEPSFFSDDAPFSVRVNAPSNGVPDHGSTMLLLGVSLAGIVALRRRLSVTA